MMRPPSEGTAPTTVSSESPSSIAGLYAQRSARFIGATTPDAVSGDVPHDNGMSVNVEEARRTSDWPLDFSLESKKGYSNNLIGLSCESDPFLLRQYRYNSQDNYHMFRLDFRKITDGSMSQPTGCATTGNAYQPELSRVPLQFMMSDESIWQDDIKATEKHLSGGDGSEVADMALLNKIVSPDLGLRLIKL